MGLSLAKGQSLSLAKQDGSNTPLTSIILGLGWDPVGRGRDVDLDASIILFDARGKETETVYFGHKKSKDKAIVHSGDNLTGAGDGDDEQIRVDLPAINPNVVAGVLVITSYSGQKFDEVENVYARVLDASTPAQTELVRYNLAQGGKHTGSVVAKFEREGAGWKFTAIGNGADGRVASKLVKDAKDVL
jgi:tellurium resistance protein TerZ